jgi:hypothetical protein
MCSLKEHCTPSKQRRVARWENEAVLDLVQARLDQRPDAMIVRRSTAEHPFGTISDTLQDEDAAQRRHRDGLARARLEYHHRGHR